MTLLYGIVYDEEQACPAAFEAQCHAMACDCLTLGALQGMDCFYLDQTDFDDLKKPAWEAGKQSVKVWHQGSKYKGRWIDELKKRQRQEKVPDSTIDRYSEPQQQYFKETGAWSETYLYLWLEQVLPDFGPNNWVSSIRR